MERHSDLPYCVGVGSVFGHDTCLITRRGVISGVAVVSSVDVGNGHHGYSAQCLLSRIGTPEASSSTMVTQTQQKDPREYCYTHREIFGDDRNILRDPLESRRPREAPEVHGRATLTHTSLIVSIPSENGGEGNFMHGDVG